MHCSQTYLNKFIETGKPQQIMLPVDHHITTQWKMLPGAFSAYRARKEIPCWENPALGRSKDKICSQSGENKKH